MPTWAEEHHRDLDRGLKQYSTARRWEQYKAGEITREKAVELATKRALKEIEKDTAAKLARLDRVAVAPDLTFISISVDWVRSRTWGNNPHAEARTNTGTFSGTASGCGYDKESAAIAEALNQCDSVLKVLYTLKENGLRAGLSDKSKTAACGRSNGDICGYGAVSYTHLTPSAGDHGSLFVAGENGAELVGHVNGTTEVLNRFQLAQVMRSSIVSGMSQFTGYWRTMNSQMVVCSNAIIRSILVSSDVMNASLATVGGSYDPTNALAQSVYEDSQRAYNLSLIHICVFGYSFPTKKKFKSIQYFAIFKAFAALLLIVSVLHI